ncbi:MAG: bacillithiol system redox-active protein YtxJ [Longimicrobiales bacterium]|nr:bacillithiol system redox-active protein YtxJ [Longimicrobiales bacterium]
MYLALLRPAFSLWTSLLRRGGSHGNDAVASLAEAGGASALAAAGPRLIFKHSTACPFSLMAAEQVRRFAERRPEVPVLRVLVLQERALSNAVAEATGVLHESPQVIWMEDGEVRGHLSHGEVRTDALEAWFPAEEA